MRRAPLLAALAVMALLAAAPGAVAATFCVAKPSCAGTPEPDLPHALNDAAASHADFRDRIELGAGTFGYPGQATDGPGNDVDIVGAGRGLTTLSATGTVLSMSDASSTLSDLRISASGAPARLLDVTAGTVKRVDIDATGTDAGASTVGVRLRGRGAVLDDASIVMAAGQTDYAVLSDAGASQGAPVARNLIAEAEYAAYATGDGGLGIESSDLHGRAAGIRATAGSVTVDDTVVRVAGGVGISANVPSGASSPAGVTVRQATVLLSQAATGLEAVSDTAGEDATIQASDTVIHGVGTAAAAGGIGGTGTITLDYSSYAFGATTGNVAGGTAHHDLDDPPPGFVDEGGGDPRLTAGSPLVDAGDPAQTAGPSTDLAKQPRLRDGNGDGAAVRDIGAFEYQRLAPSVAVSATPASAGTDQEIQYSALVVDGDPGEVPTVRWEFDDGGTATGVTASHAFATAGTHTATATATDPTGLTGTSTIAVEVVGDNAPLPAHGPRIYVRVLRARLDRHRVFLIGVFCPATERPRCVGSVTVRRGRSRIAYTRLRIQPGGTQIAKVRVSVATAALAHRRRRLRVVASVNATDLLGHATTKAVRLTLRPRR